jgi:hypothetical protein
MMTWRVSLVPKKAYLSVAGSYFNSSFGGEIREGTGGMPDVVGKGFFGIFQGAMSIAAVVSNNELTSST